MAITLKEIITIDEYLEVFPQDQAVEEDLIQSAINRAVMTLDGICGGMIAKVWDVTVTTDPLYRTEEEKGFIKQAHLLQAQYNISRNLDMSAGSESYTSGSNNYNETRPRADLVADEVIYQLLAQARVYNPNITTDTTITGDKLNSAGGFYDPTYDPLDNYVTYNVGDLRYVMKHTNNTDKFLHTDSNGNVDYVTISASPTGTSSAIANFITIAGVEYQLGGAATWGGITGNIEDQQDLQQALSNKQDTLIAGENITIENNVISATGGSSYTAGNGLQLSNNEFSIDEQVTATKTDLSRKQDLLTTLPGYDSTKYQVLVNDNGTIKWDESGEDPLCFTSTGESTIQLTIVGDEALTNAINIYYKKKLWNNWTPWFSGTSGSSSIITLQDGETLYILNTATTLSESDTKYVKFVMTGSLSASGNVNSMINYGELSEYCYYNMFYVCASLITAPELPATTLAAGCYYQMFCGCKGLTSIPANLLPATTLDERCYQGMFDGCKGLTSIPANLLPATTLKYACYSRMFESCSSLTQAPDLPATSLISECYREMFKSCSSLTQAPYLPATSFSLTSECYYHMFDGCSALKVNENGTEGTTIFTCPSSTSLQSVANMFIGTGGSFTGTPTAGNTYKWYE